MVAPSGGAGDAREGGPLVACAHHPQPESGRQQGGGEGGPVGAGGAGPGPESGGQGAGGGRGGGRRFGGGGRGQDRESGRPPRPLADRRSGGGVPAAGGAARVTFGQPLQQRADGG